MRRAAEHFEDRFTAAELIDMAEGRVQTQTRGFGVDGSPTANAREDLAAALEKGERWTEARVLREEVLAARRRNIGEDAVLTLAAEGRLALNLSHGEQWAEALPLAIHARDSYRKLGDSERADQLEQVVISIRSDGALGGD